MDQWLKKFKSDLGLVWLFKRSKLGILGDLSGKIENTQNEIDTETLGFQHTYLDARFNIMKFQVKSKQKQEETDWLLKEGCFIFPKISAWRWVEESKADA